MAAGEAASANDIERVRSELASEREQLAEAVGQLRESTHLTRQLQSKLPLLIAGAFAAGFVLSGGMGATMRLVFRRGREGQTAARAGRYTLVRR